MTVDIRPYESRDWHAICRIHDAARLDELRGAGLLEAYLDLAATFENEGLFDDQVWVAECEGRVAGFIAERRPGGRRDHLDLRRPRPLSPRHRPRARRALHRAGGRARLDVLRDELMKDRSDAATPVATVTEGVLRHILRHIDIYRRELADGGGTLHAMLSRHFRGTTEILLERGRIRLPLTADGVADSAVADAAACFLADGTVGVIDGWLRHPRPRVEDFLRVYLALLPEWWPHRPAV
ncbi:hypothetical protein [Microbacterium sp. LWS13-1.2]|uniref:GNAT family N-acetyltransferase n=1 Tax=Microbacterium sp. LWS13-1.2 TaxID=3135264 RepID=A0AAU6SAY5_9MICO